MKIKHFQGYGSVNATKVSKTTFTDLFGQQRTKLIIKVQGLHEYGLKVNDTYDGVRWLLSKFDKTAPTESYKVQMTTFYGADVQADNEYGYEEVCFYNFIY